MQNFKQKVVWITGASSGIGEAMAQEFAHQGAYLILSARRAAELERVRNKLALPSESVLVLPLDLEQPETFPALVETALANFNRIDVLVHNGGISQRAPVKDAPLALDKKIMAVNYFGAVALTKAVLPSMLRQQSGHLVVISSLVGKFGTPFRSAYAASKHALHGFFDSLRAEIWRDHIKVTIICPGYIRTAISLHALNGNMERHNQLDENQTQGMPADVCARKIVRVVAAGKQEVVIGGKETWGVFFKRLAPVLFSQIIRKMVIK